MAPTTTLPQRPILIVEDNEDLRQTLTELLEGHGHVVVSATNGREGLQQFQDTNPSVVLLDLMMPVMSGFEFIEALRERGRSDVPVVIVSAYCECVAPDAGVAAVIPKPMNFATLLSSIERLLH